VIIKT